MTNLRQAAQQALEALKKHGAHTPTCDHLMLLTSLPPQRKPCSCGLATAITALRAALAEPEQEPVAWMYHGIRHDGTLHDRPSLIWKPEYMDVMSAEKGAKATPLYTAPTPRKPLTDEEIRRIYETHRASVPLYHAIARAIEAHHGITGEQT